MGIFKVPRATSSQRIQVILEVAEVVFDIDTNTYYGGDGATYGGFPIGSGVSGVIETYTLTATNITNKNIQLGSTPAIPNLVRLTPKGGLTQIYGIDYSVSGNILSWNGLGLDNFLEAGDIIVISY